MIHDVVECKFFIAQKFLHMPYVRVTKQDLIPGKYDP